MFCKDCRYSIPTYDGKVCPICNSKNITNYDNPDAYLKNTSSKNALKIGVGIGVISLLVIAVVFGFTPTENIPQEMDNMVGLGALVLNNTSTTIEKIAKESQSSNPSSVFKPDFSEDQIETLVYQLTNDERQKNGKSTLSLDSKLSSIARNHSQDMAKRNYFSHDTPEGKDPAARGNSAGYSCYKDYGSYYTVGIAENIFQNWLFSSYMTEGVYSSYTWDDEESIAKSTVDGWMDSPGHRENILENSYDRIGIGVAISNDDAVYITQNFC